VIAARDTCLAIAAFCHSLKFYALAARVLRVQQYQL